MPYLAGERCPHNDAAVRGGFVGLSLSTGRAELQTALLEGVSFAIKDCVRLIPGGIQAATVCGGGAKSELWVHILANVLETEISVIQSEGPALGAAVLAAGAAGFQPLVRPAIVKTAQPSASIAAIYRQKYAKFRTLYPALKYFYKEEA